jgi:hypothetical protein
MTSPGVIRAARQRDATHEESITACGCVCCRRGWASSIKFSPAPICGHRLWTKRISAALPKSDERAGRANYPYPFTNSIRSSGRNGPRYVLFICAFFSMRRPDLFCGVIDEFGEYRTRSARRIGWRASVGGDWKRYGNAKGSLQLHCVIRRSMAERKLRIFS